MARGPSHRPCQASQVWQRPGSSGRTADVVPRERRKRSGEFRLLSPILRACSARGTFAPTGHAPTVLPAHPADRAHQTKLNRCRHTGPAGHHPGSWVSGRNSVLINATSPTSEDKARTRLIRWLRKRAETAGQRLFACDDLRAIHNGWQITTRCGGLGRQYRDPRFDTLRSCPRCAGRGTARGEPCGACAATGRITIPTSRTGREVRPDDRDSFAPVE